MSRRLRNYVKIYLPTSRNSISTSRTTHRNTTTVVMAAVAATGITAAAVVVVDTVVITTATSNLLVHLPVLLAKEPMPALRITVHSMLNTMEVILTLPMGGIRTTWPITSTTRWRLPNNRSNSNNRRRKAQFLLLLPLLRLAKHLLHPRLDLDLPLHHHLGVVATARYDS